MSSDFPLSMRLVGLEPGFTHQQWEQVMLKKDRHEIDIQILYLAYQEWEDEQSPELDDSPWRWYLSYLGKPQPEGEETIHLDSPPSVPPNTPIIEGFPVPPNMVLNGIQEATAIMENYATVSSQIVQSSSNLDKLPQATPQ